MCQFLSPLDNILMRWRMENKSEADHSRENHSRGSGEKMRGIQYVTCHYNVSYSFIFLFASHFQSGIPERMQVITERRVALCRSLTSLCLMVLFSFSIFLQ
ncbi:unnamed protein product [Prunus armeniaca]